MFQKLIKNPYKNLKYFRRNKMWGSIPHFVSFRIIFQLPKKIHFVIFSENVLFASGTKSLLRQVKFVLRDHQKDGICLSERRSNLTKKLTSSIRIFKLLISIFILHINNYDTYLFQRLVRMEFRPMKLVSSIHSFQTENERNSYKTYPFL